MEYQDAERANPLEHLVCEEIHLMSTLPIPLTLIVILAFAALLFLAIIASRKQAAEIKSLAITLGYQEVSSRPDQLISRVESIYQRGDGHSIQIDHVYSKQDWDQELYIYDVSDSSQDAGQMGSEVFGVISKQLALPHFTLTTLPGFDGSTLIGGLMEGLLNKVLSIAEKYHGLQRIELPDRPDLDENVILFGKNPSAVRDLIDRIDLRSITRIETPVHISGLNDFLSVDFSQMGSYSDREHDLIAQHREFTQIVRNFTN